MNPPPTPLTISEEALKAARQEIADDMELHPIGYYVQTAINQATAKLEERVRELEQLLTRLHRECLVPDFAHDAFGSCPICRLLSTKP
jgi:hypothetical protein